MGRDIVLNTLFELRNRAEYSPPKLLLSQRTKEAFHQIEPGRAGGDKVKEDSFFLFDPIQNLCMCMGRILIQNDMDFLIFWHCSFYFAEKFQDLLVSMPLRGFPNDLAGGRFQCNEEVRGPMARIIMRHGSGTTGLKREPRLCPVPGWNSSRQN